MLGRSRNKSAPPRTMMHRKKNNAAIVATTTKIPIVLVVALSSLLVVLPPCDVGGVAIAASPTVDVLCTAGPDGEEDCQAVYFEPDVRDEFPRDDTDDDPDVVYGDDYFLSAGGCVDTNNPDFDCPAMAESGECETNPGFTKYRCALSCGTCDDFDVAYGKLRDGTGGRPCTDEYKECKGWAAMGECAYNPDFMLVECQRSCVVCFEDT